MINMNLEQGIKSAISKKLEDGSIEKLIEEQLEKGVEKVLGDLFGHFGDAKKVIEEQIKSVMIPYLENYDYSAYITKLDSVLVDLLKQTSSDNVEILHNFQELMSAPTKDTVTIDCLFNKWMDYVSKHVETEGLEIDYDDDVSYEPVEVSYEVEHDEDRSWSSFKYATLVFKCEHDEEMNFVIRLSRYEKDPVNEWDVRYDKTTDIRSLKHLNDFEILLINLDQHKTKLLIDKDYDDCEVFTEEEPEANFY